MPSVVCTPQIAGTTGAWVDVDNIRVEDSAYAQRVLNVDDETAGSGDLGFQNFDPLLPVGAVITGIMVRVLCHQEGDTDITESGIFIYGPTDVIGSGVYGFYTSRLANNGPSLPSADDWLVYGGPGDLWTDFDWQAFNTRANWNQMYDGISGNTSGISMEWCMGNHVGPDPGTVFADAIELTLYYDIVASSSLPFQDPANFTHLRR